MTTMNKAYYKKASPARTKRVAKIIGIMTFSLGIMLMVYIFLPLISWQLYFAPVFASQSIATPIPKTIVVTMSTVKSILGTVGKDAVIDYTNAQNWFTNAPSIPNQPEVRSYTITIPAIGIKEAVVSTVDYNLASHLVHYGGTALPGKKGNAVIFGHSTLPQLFNQSDYKTILANAYKLKTGDQVGVRVGDISYFYSVFSITVVDPDETSVFAQPKDERYLTLVTCTPPGTIWKRLIIKARLTTMEEI